MTNVKKYKFENLIFFKLNIDDIIHENISPLLKTKVHNELYKPIKNKSEVFNIFYNKSLKGLKSSNNSEQFEYKKLKLFDSINSLRDAIHSNQNETSLHRILKDISMNSNLNFVTFHEVGIKKTSNKGGRIDILIFSESNDYCQIIELKGSKARCINTRKFSHSKPVQKAVEQAEEYSNSLLKRSNAKLNATQKKVIIGRSSSSSEEYQIIHLLEVEKNIIIQSWDDFLQTLERIIN